MISKILIVLAAIAVVVAAAVLLSGKNTNKKPSEQTTTQTQQQTTTTPTVGSPTATGGAMQESVTVTVTASGFNPQVVSIKAGTKVVWVNKSGQTVNVSSDPHPTHTAYPPLNLGNFDDGEQVSLIFDKPGRYGYHNHLDASQTGTVEVSK